MDRGAGSQVEREIALLTKLQHPNIVGYVGAVVHPDFTLIAIGTLHNLSAADRVG